MCKQTFSKIDLINILYRKAIEKAITLCHCLQQFSDDPTGAVQHVIRDKG